MIFLIFNESNLITGFNQTRCVKSLLLTDLNMSDLNMTLLIFERDFAAII